MKISVNADDYGISEAVSKTISEFIHKGYCDTTTVMANMPDYEKMRDIAVDEGIADKVGIHLCLTEGAPITAAIADYPAFVQGGLFGCYKKNRSSRFVLDKKTKTAVRDELRAQIERYLSLGYTGMAMDSHQGIHMDWSIYPIVIELFKEYGFKRLRRSPNLKNDIKRKVLRAPFDMSMRRNNIPRFDCLGNFKDFRNSIAKLKNSDKTVEIMCHPKEISGTIYIDWCSDLTLNDYMKEIEICKSNKFGG